MTRVEAIRDQINSLSPSELAELRQWMAEQESDAWDRQIEQDAKSGKLDKLFAKARADHAEGKSTKL